MSCLRSCGLFALLAVSLTSCGGSKRPGVEVESADKAKVADGGGKKDGDEKKGGEKGKFTDLAALHAEVSVLQVLHGFDLTDEQRKGLAELAEKTAQDAPARKEYQVDAGYRKALLALREALREGDDGQIDEASKALDAAREIDDPVFDPVEVTASARTHAPAVFARLSSRQIVFYLSGLGDRFPDPAELMAEAVAKARSLEGKAWQNYRDDVAFQVGQLLGGLDEKQEQKSRDRATLILDKAHDLDDKDYRQQREKLDESVRDLIGKLGSLDVVRRYLERVLAEMLSNPRVAAALAGRQNEPRTK